MSRKSSFIRAGAVLAVALAVGHVVQSASDRDKMTPLPAAAEKPSRVVHVSAGEDALGAPAVVPPAVPVQEFAALTDATAPLPLPAPVVIADAPDCKPKMELHAAAQQMIAVTLLAECQPGQRVVLRHAGLAIAETLDAGGRLELSLPALDAKGEVSALFENASIATGHVDIPGMDKIRRFAVQWMAADTFSLHAMQNGTDYDTPVQWSDAPISAAGGYIIALGDPGLDLPMMAEIYTWPTDATRRLGPVIEAEVTELTCGREMLGETLLAADGLITVSELTLAMPECDAMGDILVLNNLVPDMTLMTAN